MEVNGLTPMPLNIHNRANEAIRFSAQESTIPENLRKNEIKIEDVTMDLEEMKNFLFMMLRGGAIMVENDSPKLGKFVNRVA
ncbi:MAG: hypothetical protein N2316_09790 [Spirochaetes bacterium]|nr:hypothetical protein [Spirochaetota bacterium]